MKLSGYGGGDDMGEVRRRKYDIKKIVIFEKKI